MKKAQNKSIDALHQSFRDTLKGHTKTDPYNIETIELDGGFGNGNISLTSFEDGISVINLEATLFKDVTISLENPNHEMFHFFYLRENHCFHNFKGVDNYQKIEVFSPTVAGSNPTVEGQLILKKDVHVSLNIISIDSSEYFMDYKDRFLVSDDVFLKMRDVFSALKNYVYECSHNLKITQDLEDTMNCTDYPPITYRSALENKYKLILSQYISQLYNEFYEERVVIDLTRTELKKVKKVTDHITENPGIDLSLDKLCSLVIMSQSKLQKGFKCIHNTTVSNYIRDVRLEKAKDLLLNSDLNVSEIVYSVGFTSRSYFCKIFKNKYGLNPTSYRSKYKDQSIQADMLNMV